MKKTERILLIIAFFAILLKFMLINGSGLLTVLSLMSLAVIYYLLGFAFFNSIRLKDIFKKQSYNGISVLRIIGTIGFGFSISTVIIGILFILQSWNGGSVNLITGLAILLICTVVAIIRWTKTKSGSYNLIFSRAAIIGFFGLLFLITPKMTVFEILHRNHPAYVEAVRNLNNDPNNEELQAEVDHQIEIIRSEK